MKMKILTPLLFVLLLCAPKPAAADEVNPVFLALGGLKVPGIAFDIVGAGFLGPHLETFDTGSRMHRSTQAAFASHLVSLGLHTLSVGSFMAGAFADWEDAVGPVFLINAGADITIGVMGILTGLDILMSKSTVEIKGQNEGVSATWSGVLNIAMGSFGVLWFSPMLIGGLVGVAKLAVAPRDGPESRIALRVRRPQVWATLVPSPTGVTPTGIF